MRMVKFATAALILISPAHAQNYNVTEPSGNPAAAPAQSGPYAERSDGGPQAISKICGSWHGTFTLGHEPFSRPGRNLVVDCGGGSPVIRNKNHTIQSVTDSNISYTGMDGFTRPTLTTLHHKVEGEIEVLTGSGYAERVGKDPLTYTMRLERSR